MYIDILNGLFWTALCLNIGLWYCKSHEKEMSCSHEKLGRFDACVGIEEQGTRDFDLTISWEPRWYFTFQLSLWTVYCGCSWSRDIVSYADCKYDGVECYACGCTKQCEAKEEVE